MNFGKTIRKIRKLKGYSQYYVATKLAISQRQLSRIENNQSDLKISRLERICEILEIKMEQLLNFDENTLFNTLASNTNSQFSNIHQNKIQSLEKEMKMLKKLLRQKD